MAIDLEKLQSVSMEIAVKYQDQINTLVTQILKMQIEERAVFLTALFAGSIVLDSQQDIDFILEGMKESVPVAKTQYLEELGKNLRKQGEQK